MYSYDICHIGFMTYGTTKEGWGEVYFRQEADMENRNPWGRNPVIKLPAKRKKEDASWLK